MVHRAFSFVPAIPALAILVACSSAAPREVELEVAHFRQPCGAVDFPPPHFCLRVANPPGAPWTTFNDAIAGFDPEWGTSYRIRVEVRDIEDPPADSSSLEYRLLQIVSEKVEAQGTGFSVTFQVEQAQLLAASSDGALQLLNGPKLSCADEAACQAARAWVAKPLQKLLLSLEHPARPGTELVVTASSTN